MLEGPVCIPLAYFLTEEKAKKAMETLDYAILREVIEEWHGYQPGTAPEEVAIHSED